MQNQALFPDDPVKKVRCFILSGNLTDDRLCLIPLHGDRLGFSRIALCVLRLKSVGMHTLCTVVSLRKCCTGCCGNTTDFLKTAIIHFAVQLRRANVIGIGQRNVQSRRIVPTASIRTDTALHRCRKRWLLRILNKRHLHAVLFADIS